MHQARIRQRLHDKVSRYRGILTTGERQNNIFARVFFSRFLNEDIRLILQIIKTPLIRFDKGRYILIEEIIAVLILVFLKLLSDILRRILLIPSRSNDYRLSIYVIAII